MTLLPCLPWVMTSWEKLANIIIDREAGEIIHLLASVCGRSKVKAQGHRLKVQDVIFLLVEWSIVLLGFANQTQIRYTLKNIIECSSVDHAFNFREEFRADFKHDL